MAKKVTVLKSPVRPPDFPQRLYKGAGPSRVYITVNDEEELKQALAEGFGER